MNAHNLDSAVQLINAHFLSYIVNTQNWTSPK